MRSNAPRLAEFDAVERAIVDHLFLLSPSYAVSVGLHEYDGKLPDLSSKATERWAAQADRLLARLRAIPIDALPPARRADRTMLELLLESPLFDLRESHEYERNPMVYLGSASVTAYLVRPYAPALRRAERIAELLEGVPRLLDEGRRRLQPKLPKPFVELALSIGRGLPAHYADAVAFARSAGENVGARVERAASAAGAAVEAMLRWLSDERLPSASEEFALGAERFARLLYVREGLTTPIAEIERRGRDDLARNQSRLAAIAREAGRSVPELLQAMTEDRATAESLIPTARATVEAAKQFVIDHDLVRVPSTATCRVEETPVWARALSTASMDSPGPFESASSEGVYYVTPVDPAWSPTQSEEWLKSLNRPVLKIVTVHEVYPGHYLQFLHLREAPGSLTRKVYFSPSFVEGWAHYTEQLAIEAGLAQGAPLLEVAQLHEALLRNCRLLVSIGLHTHGWSLKQATAFFEREAHLEHLPAQREAIRGTFNPEYFCYTLGKLAILELRERHLAGRFHGSLRAFHDTLLGFGSPPIGLLESLVAHAGP